MPPKYEKWFPKFTSNDVVIVEDHMNIFWAFFQIHPISDDAEYLAMKLFSATLDDGTRRWYNGLPDASIKTMNWRKCSSNDEVSRKTPTCCR
jgi:hypothetical protein